MENNIIILSDSLSGLQAIADKNNTHALVHNIHNNLQRMRDRRRSVEFVWVKAHVGLVGNETADNSAKSAAVSHHPYVYTCFPVSYLKQRLKEATIVEAGQIYSNSSTGQHTRSLLPTVEVIRKVMGHFKYSFAMTQVLTGHGYHLEYLYRFKIKTTDKCPCDGVSTQSLNHLIKNCPKFTRSRARTL